MSSASALDGVVRGLAGLRARIRALFLVSGLSGFLLLAAVATVLFFAADVFLDLPLGVRRFLRLGVLDRHPGLPFLAWLPLAAALGLLAVLLTRGGRGAAAFVSFLFAGVVGLLVWRAWRALRPLAVRLPDAELVLEVERRHAGLQDRLAAALDFAGELPEGRRGESRPMMQAVIHQAEREAGKVSLPAVASGKTALAWAWGAALALLVAFVVLGVDGERTGLWARRSLLLEEVAWPRASDVLAVVLSTEGEPVAWPADKPYEVAVGRGLVVHAQVRGKPVDEVLLLDLAEDQQPLPRRMFPVTAGSDVYGVELTNVRQAFRFVLRGGDDQDDLPIYRVEVTVPPAVLDIGAELTFPPYLTRPPERVSGGNLAVPQGTDVVVTFTASVPLTSARALLGDLTVPATRLSADGGGEAWRFAFKAERSLRYRLLLATPEGRQNDPAADSFDVAVGEDRPPRVDWIWPRGGVEVTQKGRVPLLLRTLDDHGVRDLVLEVRVGADGPVTSIGLLPRARDAVGAPGVVDTDGQKTLEANDGPLGRPQVLTYVPLEVAAHVPTTGGSPSLAVRMVAKDSKGQAREGSWLQVSIYGATELERILAGRRAGVKSSVLALVVEAETALRRAAELARGPLGDAERDLLKTMQYAQGKIARDADAAVRDFVDVFNLFVLDRLGSEHPTERVLAIFDRHHRRTYGTEDAPLASAGAHADDPVFPYALYDEIVAAWRSKSLLDNGVLDRMCAVLSDAVEVGARLAPAAHAASVRASAGGPPEVEALRAAEQALLDGLDRLKKSLGSWETLSDVILELRRIVEEQKALHSLLDGKPQEKPGDTPENKPADGPPPGSR